MVGTGYDQGNSIFLDLLGNVYSTGMFQGTCDFDPGVGTFTLTSIGGWDSYVSKLDASGNFIWAKQLGGISNDYGYSLTVDTVGNVYTTGTFKNTVDFDPGVGTFSMASVGNSDIFISKLNSSGNFVWAIQIGDTSVDIANSIAVDVSGNVYSTGSFKYKPDFDPGPGTFTLTAFGNTDGFIHKICQGCAVGIKENFAKNNISIFPNPTKNILNFTFPENVETTYCKIFNSTGQLLLEKTDFTSDKITLDISELSDGIYFLEIKTINGVARSKVIKN